jgi:uncharacterized membrane protein YhfC
VTEDRLTVIATVLLLALFIIASWWWLPQKWQACQKLYDNRPAQIFCFGSK